MPEIVIELSDEEAATAESWGVMIFQKSRKDGRNYQKYITDKNLLTAVEEDKMSQKAELAVSKALGQPHVWKVDVFHSIPDVGRFEVRSVKEHHHHLKVRDNDEMSRPFILVVVEGKRCTLKGWDWGKEVSKPQNWNEGWHGRKGWWSASPRNIKDLVLLKEWGGSL